jgi:mono/diheme cytochrome c family protein
MDTCQPYRGARRAGRPVSIVSLSLVAALALAVSPARAAGEPSANAGAGAASTMDWRTYSSTPSQYTGPNAEQVARGKYLVTIAGCNDCHTPFKMGPAGPEPDVSRMLSGHPEQVVVTSPAKPQDAPWIGSMAETNTAFSGPWGVSFTANLTPDADTGLGKWTSRNFKDTIRSGRHLGRGRSILPPMPIAMYRNMTDADLEAVFAYLQTIPAMKNQVPEPLPPGAAPMTASEK